MNFFGWNKRPRVTEEFNTVDLDPVDGDEDLIGDVVQVFDIDISADDVKSIVTVGDLYDLIVGKLGANDDVVWIVTEHLVRTHSASRDGIDKETTLLRDFAKRRPKSP